MSLLLRYETIIASGLLKKDPLQLQVLVELQKLCDKLTPTDSAKAQQHKKLQLNPCRNKVGSRGTSHPWRNEEFISMEELGVARQC